MDSKNKIIPIVVAFVLGVTFIFYVVSNALPSWSTISSGSFERTSGLWKICDSYSGVQQCQDFACTSSTGDSLCSRILASRAFMTLACIVSAIAVFSLVLSIFITDGMRLIVLTISKGLAFACFIMGIIGVATGITGITNDQLGKGMGLGAGSIIGIIALIINLVGAIGSLIIK